MLIGRVITSFGIVHVRRDGSGCVPIEDPWTAFAEGRPPNDLDASCLGEFGDSDFEDWPAERELLAPCAPLVVVGIAQNGPTHPEPVQAWLKSPRTVIGTEVPVTLRRDAGRTVAEGEIAVVIGRDTTGLTEANAADHVLGLTAVNDLSSPDRAQVDPRNFEAKGGDGYTPLGPWIDTDASLTDVDLRLLVDDRQVAATGAGDLPVPIARCLAYVAKWCRLGPGDIVMTGAPFSQAPISPGQRVEVEVGQVRLITPTC